MPAGNCKLQTLRQYYRLPERGAHTALGDVQTVAGLLERVLRPIAEERGLDTWEKIAAFASEEWYPSRIAFGKHRGRSVWDARTDAGLRAWLEWLAQSSNPRSASMGRWYLRQIGQAAPPETQRFFSWADAATPQHGEATAQSGEVTAHFPPAADGGHRAVDAGAIALYVKPDVRRLSLLVEAARARLAELESAYTVEKAKVDALQATLFRRLCEHYRRRDRLRLLVEYWRKFLESLLASGEEEAEQVRAEYRQADARTAREYEETASAMAAKKELSPDESEEIRKLWRKLVNLFHPDRFANEPGERESYERLTAAINHAKDNGDLATLREIANDPEGYLLRQGWARLDFGDEQQAPQLRRLWESLELEIVRVLEAMNELRASREFELAALIEKDAGLLERVVAKQTSATELAMLTSEAERLKRKIEELTGEEAPA